MQRNASAALAEFDIVAPESRVFDAVLLASLALGTPETRAPGLLGEAAVASNLAAAEARLATLPAPFARTSPFLTAPTFNRYHTEHEMLRYIKRLEAKDLSLCHSMISLGSCTMKLNATSEMFPVSWPEFSKLHPFAPAEQTRGYAKLFKDLETWLADITGFAGISLQPNAGSQGELAGLLAIRAYHLANGDTGRTLCLIPSSAHGTNAASAVMAGMVELGEDIFLKPVRRGLPRYSSGLSDMVAQPRAATVMGLMEEARLARMRGLKVSQKAGSVQNAFGRIKEWLVGNF